VATHLLGSLALTALGWWSWTMVLGARG
jgi:hypothetical protein